MGRQKSRGRRSTRRKPQANPTGVLLSRAEGYGFVRTAEGEYFIPATAMGGAFDGDLVEVAPLARKGAERGRRDAGRAEGDGGAGLPAARVLRVIDRAHDTVVGRYEVAEPFGVVVPADPRIPYDVFTLRADYPEVPDGALVRVRIAQFPTRRTAATGHIEEVVAEEAEGPRAGIDLIIGRHKLETVFSEGALAEADAAVLDETGALAAGYRDLRDRFVFTIDPADAKDFDDALSVDYLKDEGLWRLGVHIADVSHYVPWNSSVDLDARRRATSVYLADRVIPMLPEALSNGLCSLAPDEDRRAMTCDLFLDEQGDVVRFELYPALIRSRARLSYGEADELLVSADAAAREAGEAAAGDALSPEDGADGAWGTEGGAAGTGVESAVEAVAAAAGDGALAARLAAASRIAKRREAARAAAGGIDFATTEAKVVLDDAGMPVDIAVRRKTDATRLIEEAMILANETVAAFLEVRGFPCLYRVHEAPAADALGSLIPIFQEFPWFERSMEGRLVAADPRAIQEILAASAGRSEGELVSSLLLRAMKRAVYRPVNDGHYGLASEVYCHFTSPIRRYPDLVVHRMLRAALTRRPEKFDQEVAALPWIAEHSSDMERVADTAARESQELKMVEYLRAFTGQAFSAVVSGVANWCLYVRLDCTAEGVLPVRALGEEYFAFDPVRYTLTGEESGRSWRLGQRIPVVLKTADPATRTLEFALAAGRS